MSINPKLLQKRLSDVRWHMNMSSDVDSNLYAAVDGLTDIVGDLIAALTPPASGPGAAGEPDHGQPALELPAAGLSRRG